MKLLAEPSTLVFLVSLWWICIAIWGVTSRAQSRRMLLVVGAFALSVTLYVEPVGNLVARVIGSEKPCNQFENLWGVGVSAAVVVAVGAIKSRRAMVVALAAAAAIGVLIVLSATSATSPVGCITSIDQPWYSPYWWILVTAHIGSSLIAAISAAKDAAELSHTSPLAAAPLVGVAGGFLLSTFFWLLMMLTLITGNSEPGTWGATNVFPLTTLVFTLCTAAAAILSAVTLSRSLSHVAYGWKQYQQLHQLIYPGAPPPRFRHLAGGWWRHPHHTAHHLNIQTHDLRLNLQNLGETHV